MDDIFHGHSINKAKTKTSQEDEIQPQSYNNDCHNNWTLFSNRIE